MSMKIWPHVNFISPKRRRNIADYFTRRKEGVISGAADNDPAGIVTLLQVGATTGYGLLWLMVLSTPMLIVVEEMSAKVGIVLKKGLAKIMMDHYGKPITMGLVLLVTFANIVTIGANIAGMADVFAIIFGMEEFYGIFVLLVGLIVGLFLLRGGYSSISRYLFLLTPIFLVYVVAVFMVNPSWGDIALGLVGAKMKFELSYWALAVGLLGTTIAPYIMFWETTEEVEAKKKIADIRDGKAGIRMGMVYSNLIAIFMIILAGAVMYGGGAFETIREAAEVLQPLVGNAAFGLFAVGILGAGFISVPVLTASTGYMVSEVFGWQTGLDKQEKQAPAFYIVILFAILVGIIIALLGFNPVKMLVWSQVLAGFVVPFMVVGLLIVNNNKNIMGKYVNGWRSNTVGIFTVLVMLVSIVLFIADLFK